jgi:iron(III) transport system substrate-binding protein
MKRVFSSAMRIVLLFCGASMLCSCAPEAESFPSPDFDLTIYTCQDASVYDPVIKEFQERTGKQIDVRTGSFSELEQELTDGTLAESCDLVFGADAATLTRYREFWQPYQCADTNILSDYCYDPEYYWTGFSTMIPVILYNTKVVTYRELPVSWNSLLEPRWKDRIAFVNPEASHDCAAALISAAVSSEEPDAYLDGLAANVTGSIFSTSAEAYDAVADGQCSIGIAREEDAAYLCRNNIDIDYIYPSEGVCLIPDGSAIVANCAHPEAAAEFLEFTISKDTQRILVSHLNRRSVRRDIASPAGLSALSNLTVYPLDYQAAASLRDRLLDRWQADIAALVGGDRS